MTLLLERHNCYVCCTFLLFINAILWANVGIGYEGSPTYYAVPGNFEYIGQVAQDW